MPGAELFDTAQEHGEFEGDWKKLGFWDPVFIPSGMTKQQLIDSHMRMYRKFYLRPSIILRYLIKCITHPRTIANYVTAGVNVVKYSLSGYVRKKMKNILQKRLARKGVE
jgi:hypothetical protein